MAARNQHEPEQDGAGQAKLDPDLQEHVVGMTVTQSRLHDLRQHGYQRRGEDLVGGAKSEPQEGFQPDGARKAGPDEQALLRVSFLQRLKRGGSQQVRHQIRCQRLHDHEEHQPQHEGRHQPAPAGLEDCPNQSARRKPSLALSLSLRNSARVTTTKHATAIPLPRCSRKSASTGQAQIASTTADWFILDGFMLAPKSW